MTQQYLQDPDVTLLHGDALAADPVEFLRPQVDGLALGEDIRIHESALSHASSSSRAAEQITADASETGHE